MHETMNRLGRLMGAALNEGAAKKGMGRWGFCLMVFPLEDFDGRCNYISNANRDDVVTLLKEQLARFEGQADVEGHA